MMDIGDRIPHDKQLTCT
uniref:Uncharacterized protein n=1 Tax=Anguilla anguilla TaxID=7936 RepID=A0A0E9VKG7_ANGAN